ncbi:hypothetical protein TRVA0_043S00232 [Trichomonascus vanleenenianus]|uniref:uncharacterized protein n=1 Tax=Trichomonascus vanleenenianus TaxID=2268995 RepID=UPI003ECB18C9
MATPAESSAGKADFVCWICLCGPNDPPPPGTTEHNWRRPCGCSLVAHQACILDWAAEESSNGNDEEEGEGAPASSNGRPLCPQCKTPIYITTPSSRLLTVRQIIEAANANGFLLLFLTTLGGCAVSSMYTTLYCAGATAIRFVCPTDMALSALGISITESGIQVSPLSWRRLLMIPSIPVALVLSQSRSRMAGAFVSLLPLGLATKEQPPWKFSGARLSLAMLPIARFAYQNAYDRFVDPIIQSCAAQVRPSYYARLNDEGEEEDAGENNPGRQIEVALEDGEDRVIVNIVENDEIPPALGLVNRTLLRSINFIVDIIDPAPEDEAIPALQQLHPSPHEGDWVIGPRSLLLAVGHSLLWPLLGGITGTVLSGIAPWFKRFVPSRFNRNLIGALLVVCFRDVVNVLTAMARVRLAKTKRVLNVQEVRKLRRS